MEKESTLTYASKPTNATSDMVKVIEKLSNIDKEVAAAPGVLQTNTLAAGVLPNKGKARDFTIGKEYWKSRHTPGGEDIASVLRDFDRIEAKSNCTIVKILDYIANYLEKTSEKTVTRIREYAMHITTPCSIVKKSSWFSGWVFTK